MKFHPKYRKNALLRYEEKHPTQIFEGATLTTAQRKIADWVTTGAERFYVWCAGRQVGKSFTATQILLWFALNKPNTVSMYVSMTYTQTLKLFNELYRGVKDSGIISSFSRSNFEIQFKNNSTIYFKSYQNADSSRGYHISGVLIIDEAAFMNDGDFDKIYLPMLQNHRTAKALIISSPRGCNWFYNYYMMGERGARNTNKNTKSFKTTYKDNPFCDMQEIESLKLTMPEMIYRQEILAEFISGAASAFGTKYKDCISYNIHTTPRQTERYYMGVDVGRQNDYTVATVVSEISGEVVEILRLRQLPFEQIAAEVVKIAQKWRPAATLQETNGIGDPFFDMLSKKFNEKYIGGLTPWTTTNQSKNNIIEALNIAFDEKSIIIPHDNDLLDEIEVFEVKYSMKSHAVTYAARTGYHDDMIMSLAMANWAKRTHAANGLYGIC
jgi:phage FluMu gp28-like protein